MTLQHTITRKIEFDAAHRIPEHKSKCRNIHGHRYVLEATISGQLFESGSQRGMVADFASLKTIMMEEIGEPWDHALLVWDRDTEGTAASFCIKNNKTVYLPSVPTAENLARMAYDKIKPRLHASVHLVRVRVYETPNCWADYSE